MWAITLTSQVRCHSSSDASGPPGGPGTPALEQNRSMGPPNSLACRTSSTISCSRLTSVLTARPPSSPATASAEGRSMSATTIARGDSAATLLASARPIPLPAPVITTFRSASSMGADRLVFSVGAMEFELTDRCKELRERLLAFMEEHVYPAEPVYQRQLVGSGDPHFPPPVMEELKAQAQELGLWN